MLGYVRFAKLKILSTQYTLGDTPLSDSEVVSYSRRFSSAGLIF